MAMTSEEREEYKKKNQKLTAYVLLQYFLKYTDERHPAQMQDILTYLNEDCGICAERRLVYRGIKEINKILYILDHEDEELTIKDAEEALEDESERYIVSESNRSGYYLCRRPNNIIQ